LTAYPREKEVVALFGQVIVIIVSVDEENNTSAEALLAQSSQYHHLLSRAVQNGNGTHEMKRHGEHFTFSPPFNKTPKVTKIADRDMIIPSNRTMVIRVFTQKPVETPKNVLDK
jgi:hypothetical protein